MCRRTFSTSLDCRSVTANQDTPPTGRFADEARSVPDFARIVGKQRGRRPGVNFVLGSTQPFHESLSELSFLADCGVHHGALILALLDAYADPNSLCERWDVCDHSDHEVALP